MRKINIGILLSYDYKYSIRCIQDIYTSADTITLAIDKDRRTWAGNKYEFDEKFFDEIKKIDLYDKIKVYEDDFYDSSLTTIYNDIRERNMLLKVMETYENSNSWNIQLDADEYFIDFDGFVNYLRILEKRYPNSALCIYSNWKILFKKLEDGYLVINTAKNNPFPVATNCHEYWGCRSVEPSKAIRFISPFFAVHQSWAREPKEIKQKITNWGHNNDFDVDSYFNFWNSLDKDNYYKAKDFHPLSENKRDWLSLSYVKGDIDDVISEIGHTLPHIEYDITKSYIKGWLAMKKAVLRNWMVKNGLWN